MSLLGKINNYRIKFAQSQQDDGQRLNQLYQEYLHAVEVFVEFVQKGILESENIKKRYPDLLQKVTTDVASFVQRYLQYREKFQTSPQKTDYFRLMAKIMAAIYFRILKSGLFPAVDASTNPILKYFNDYYNATLEKAKEINRLIGEFK